MNIYIRIVRDHEKLEDENTEAFLEEHTKDKLKYIVLTECIEQQAEYLASNKETGCEHMFENDQVDLLKDTYEMFV